MLDLHAACGLFVVAESRVYSLVVVSEHLISMASLGAEHGFQQLWYMGSVVIPGLQRTASIVVVHRAKLLCGMWDLSGPGIEPMLPVLAGGFFTTEPPGKCWVLFLNEVLSDIKQKHSPQKTLNLPPPNHINPCKIRLNPLSLPFR